MPLTPREVHYDSALTTIAVAYKQNPERLIAHRVFPAVQVKKQSDVYPLFKKESWLTIQAGPRAPGSESLGGGFAISWEKTYYAGVHAFHVDIDDITRENSDFPTLLQQVTEFVTWQLLLEREAIFAREFFDDTGKTPGEDFWTVVTTNTSEPFSLSGSWWDVSSSPITDIENAIAYVEETTGFTPNVLVLGPQAWRALRKHPEILNLIAYAPERPGPRVVTPELLAAAFELEEVFIMRQPKKVPPAGVEAPVKFKYIAGPHALLVYRTKTPGLFSATGGYVFEWSAFFNGQNVRIKQFRVETLGVDRVEGEMAYDMKIVAPDLGIFLKNCGLPATS